MENIDFCKFPNRKEIVNHRGVAQLGSALGSGLIFRRSQVKRENSKGFLNSRGFPSFIFQRNPVNQVENRGYLQVDVDHVLTKKDAQGKGSFRGLRVVRKDDLLRGSRYHRNLGLWSTS